MDSQSKLTPLKCRYSVFSHQSNSLLRSAPPFRFAPCRSRASPYKKKEKAAKSQPMPSALIDNTLKCSQFPDVSTLDDESLREECKKYGLKANSQMTNKILQNSLKEVFTFLSTSTLLY